MNDTTLLMTIGTAFLVLSLAGAITCACCVKALISKLIRRQPNKIYVKRK